jgi:S-DNA-T family DNA segregation ATPase FtsK/SpoIIIE
VNPRQERIAAPEPPSPPTPHGFPVLATIAPVLVSIALWLITQSVFALLFAVLGPVVAVSSLADGRIQSRRRLRRERERFAAETVAVEAEIEAAHDREREGADARAPSATTVVEGGWPAAEFWRADTGGRASVPVRLGRGDRPSGLEFDGAPRGTRSDPATRSAVESLARHAGTLRDAPVLVDAALGVGVVGAPLPATALARAVVVQLASMLPPSRVRIDLHTSRGRRADWEWLAALPHRVRVVDDPPASSGPSASSGPPAEAAATSLVFRTDPPPAGVHGGEAASTYLLALVAVSDGRDALPAASRIVVEVRGGAARVLQHPDRAQLGPLRAELVSAAQALRWATALSALARRSGLVSSAAELPDAVAFAELSDGGGEERGARPLDCAVARTAEGVLRIDLVAQGPHAVVGGTTGSGKSELLVSWVLAMAAVHGPRDLSVLLVDFKGGSAFAAIEALPHCVGMITDLDDSTALRALESLAAELRRRERHLARRRARSVDELDGEGRLPRLVIVVDEFAAMVAGFPDLHALFSDIAARGRSLGVHLVLCTQRPVGVIRDAVLANSALRISLRVNNRADSTAVIGSDAAAALPANRRGRALVSTDGEQARVAQFPLTSSADIARVAAAWRDDAYRPHRPWLDPLPPVVRGAQLARHLGAADSGIPFGLADDPAQQSQPLACYRPTEHGNLLVIGGSGSGKSTLLATIAAAAPGALRLPADIEGAWDTLVALLDGPPQHAAPQHAAHQAGSPQHAAPSQPFHRLLLIDDLDVLLSRLPEDYEPATVALLCRVLREGPARGLRCVVCAQRLGAQLHAIAALCGSRLLLRLPNRQEHVIAGGDPSRYVERVRPGEGTWEGLRVQVAIGGNGPAPGTGGASATAAEARPSSSMAGSPATIDPQLPVAAVSSRPAEFARRLRLASPAFAAANAIVQIGPGSPSPQELAVSSGPRARAIVGDAEAWQAHWGAVASLRATHQVVVDGYTAADFRGLTRLRDLPPPLNPGSPAFWLLPPEGGVRRARIG